MEPLSPVYLSDIAAQTGSLSAFLGGFSATFLGALLALRAKGRTATVTIGFAAVAAVAFIVAVVGSTAVVAALHPQGPNVGTGGTGGAQTIMALAFIVGLYALLTALGLSGWSRSRNIGLATSIAAGLGVLLVTGMVASVG